MEFVKFREKFEKHFEEMTADASHLFEVDVDKDKLWNLYLNSFPAGTNEIYRVRREHDCSCCRHFIKSIGNVVTIQDGKVETLWDFDAESDTFQPVIDALSAYIKSCPIVDVYFSKLRNIGTRASCGNEDGKIVVYDHFQLTLPDKFIDRSCKSTAELQGEYRDTRNVFKRSLDELTEDSVAVVLELIAQNTLYKGNEWKSALDVFLKHKQEYSKLDEAAKGLYAWEESVTVGPVVGRIRNHSIGTLLIDISNGVDLDTAVRKYGQLVDPVNYKHPKAIFTKKMLEDAQKTVEELGYTDSLPRRFARLDDITVNNIIFSNKDSAKKMKNANVFADMAEDIAVNPKKFSKTEEIGIDDFVSKVLPTATELEVLLENRHTQNLVSLIAPQNPDSPSMFKWNNGFSWAYTGNITDSNIRENVKSAGGKVDGDLRFSIQWNEDGSDDCDLDAHCIEASGYEIYYSSARKPKFSPTRGQLDVDIVHPGRGVAVENITWASRNTMKPGVYRFFVHQFSGSAKNGFRAEIEFDGQVYSFNYNSPMRSGQKVHVAEVTLDTNGTFSIKETLPSNVSSREVWGLKTNQFVPVSVMMYSPNYWNEQDGIGHKHYFFMLKGCVNSEAPNGFFNEYLKHELDKHKRVFEALGGKMAVESTDEQLSGVGFSSTKRNDILVKVKGASERVLKIKF